MNYGSYAYGASESIKVAEQSVVEAFETLESYLDLSEAVDLLKSLGVDDGHLKSVVTGWALSKAGLD